MTDPPDDDLLERGITRLRRVAEPEAPFAGWLARVGEEVVQLVDVTMLRDWIGWRGRGEHVLAVQDVWRTREGHEAMLPWCVERVDAFLVRRASAGVPLSAGEAATIVVCVLRGHAAARDGDPCGAWWLTQDGTPVFVGARVGAGGEPIARATADVLERLAAETVAVRGWGIAEMVAQLEAGERTDLDEARIFGRAAPEPLILAPLTPRRASDARRSEPVRDAPVPARTQSVLARLLGRHVDADVGGMVSDAVEGARRGTRRARERFARPWIVAAAAATVLVAGGLAWPSTDAPAANARPAASEAASAATTSPDAASPLAPPGPAADSGGSTTEEAPAADGGANAADPVSALDDLLARRSDCAPDGCRTSVFEDPARTDIAEGAVDLAPASREVVLLDDLGGVAILSVTATSGELPVQLVVLVRTADGWLIRDVRDVEGP